MLAILVACNSYFFSGLCSTKNDGWTADLSSFVSGVKWTVKQLDWFTKEQCDRPSNQPSPIGGFLLGLQMFTALLCVCISLECLLLAQVMKIGAENILNLLSLSQSCVAEGVFWLRGAAGWDLVDWCDRVIWCEGWKHLKQCRCMRQGAGREVVPHGPMDANGESWPTFLAVEHLLMESNGHIL